MKKIGTSAATGAVLVGGSVAIIGLKWTIVAAAIAALGLYLLQR